MIVEEADSRRARDVLSAMVRSTEVLARLAPVWDRKKGTFRDRWSETVGQWCVDFYGRYGKAPGQDVVGLYEAWAQKADPDTAKLVETFLQSLPLGKALKKDELNAAYLVDAAAAVWNETRLLRIADQIKGLVQSGKADEALALVDPGNRVEVGLGSAGDPFTDQTQWTEVFAADREPVITYPGAIGRFYGPSLERDGFVAFLAGEKKAKTFHLFDMAYRALAQGRRTAFFEIGDLSSAQIKGRIASRVTGRPLRPSRPGEVVRFPKTLELVQGKPAVTFAEKSFGKGLDEEVVWKACQRFMDETVRSDESLFKLSVHPNDSLTAAGLRAIVDTWSRSGWNPDVIVIDYADLFAPPPGYSESRDQINATWKRLRALSQEYHCLVVTATQANAASYTAESLSMSNFSEDKRKFAHVTAMVGINQTPLEKESQIQRLNYLVRREDEFFSSRHVYVAGCLAVANPCVRSAM